ncbi:MAG TPA: 4Fe-4S dicluster domain-containing protein, partial [Dehalococcoidia bacterium]|nr:4Fe-4S dicluster domain-containing protein [Dehalococcoidia bacterium]
EDLIPHSNLLDDANKGKVSRDQFKNKRVIVIGGGNVAFDVARTARRLGGEVTVVALECEDKTSKDGIPADEDEIVGATEEGIKIIYSRGVREIRGENGKFKGINSPRCVSVFDEKGFNPKFDCSDCIDLTGDILLITIGQGADRAFLEKEGLLDERGRIAVNPVTLQSLKDDSVFIGGDARRIGFMVDAMKEGIEAAESIHRKLRGLDMMEGRKIEYEKAGTPIKHAYDPAVKVSWVPASKRMDFEMFEKGLTLKEAIEEARRCLACGPCISCKACVSIGLQESLPTVEVDEQICCGCGICVYVCNYDSARLINKEGKITSTTDMLNCKSCGMCIAACPSNARKLVGDATEQRISAVYASLT